MNPVAYTPRIRQRQRAHIIAAKIYVSPLNLCYKLRQLYVYYVRNNRLLLLPTANSQQPAGNGQKKERHQVGGVQLGATGNVQSCLLPVVTHSVFGAIKGVLSAHIIV